MSVWLSTTMIQALRNLVDLFTFYFDVLARMLDKLLDLLSECICQGAPFVLLALPAQAFRSTHTHFLPRTSLQRTTRSRG